MQSEGVAAVVKHYILNNQETARDTESSDASDRTLWEVYYPPFEAAVRAGAAAVMCAYERVNGTYACGNAHILIEHLRERMGFEGFVMSDWWALHSTDAAAVRQRRISTPPHPPPSSALPAHSPPPPPPHWPPSPQGGVDQNLPGNDLYFSLLASRQPDLADAMVHRVLRGMLMSSAWDNGVPG